jgi:hypothetical protein
MPKGLIERLTILARVRQKFALLRFLVESRDVNLFCALKINLIKNFSVQSLLKISSQLSSRQTILFHLQITRS